MDISNANHEHTVVKKIRKYLKLQLFDTILRKIYQSQFRGVAKFLNS